ncbi:hypothetical protein MKW98_024419 [Papaver atlanticum]|uniref:Uncharacterized protein n=1 Tax=Papaver atlanticum TaxID=357466 RepID=A0AAD4SYJ6_9MAGN|nr:hypothetical protein MKW98_024419 [Papaver atlanticum]
MTRPSRNRLRQLSYVICIVDFDDAYTYSARSTGFLAVTAAVLGIVMLERIVRGGGVAYGGGFKPRQRNFVSLLSASSLRSTFEVQVLCFRDLTFWLGWGGGGGGAKIREMGFCTQHRCDRCQCLILHQLVVKNILVQQNGC